MSTSSPANKLPLTLDLRGLSAADKATVTAIFDDLGGASERIRRAGVKWVALAPEVRAKVMESLPGYLVAFMQRLERVGAGTLHPQLYAAAGRAAVALGRLPIEQQEQYLTERIPVAIINDAGRPDVRKMDVAEMGLEEFRQVFERSTGRDENGLYTFKVRSVAQQRAWLAEQAAKSAANKLVGGVVEVQRAGRWKIQGKRAYPDKVKVETGLTRADLMQMLGDMGGFRREDLLALLRKMGG